MLRISIFALAMLCMPSFASAGLLDTLLTPNGLKDVMKDQSVDDFVDKGTAGFSIGDVLYGVAQVDQINNDDTGLANISPNRLAVAVAAEITGIAFTAVGTSTIVDITFGAVTDSALSLDALLDPAFKVAGNDVPVTSSSIFAVLTSVGGPLPANFVNDPDGLGAGIPDGLRNFDPSVWTVEAVGDLSLSNAHGDADFFEATLLINASGGIIAGSQRGGFSITDSSFSSDTIFLPVSVDNLAGTSTTNHDLGLTSGGIADNNEGKGWNYLNDAQYEINAIPEPASIAIWSLAIVGGIAPRRRRKK